MYVKVRMDGAAPRLWHLNLLQRLARRTTSTILLDARPGPGGLQPDGERLFRLERLIHGLARTGPSMTVDLADVAALATTASSPVDLILDLCGDVAAAGCAVWRLAFDGLAGEYGLFCAILDGRAPVATIKDGAGRTIATSRLGTETGGVAVSCFEDALIRTISLIVAALDGAASTSLPVIVGEADLAVPPQVFGPSQLARRSAKAAARSLVRRLYYRLYHAPHWRVGWRRLVGPDLVALRHHPEAGWTDLPDDGLRFYADPFPVERDGVVTLFVEDYVHSLGRGLVSAVAFGPDGPLGTPEPVLDTGYHLSYPFVFEQDGEVWMIPESCAVGRVDLFRATAFPKGWVFDRTLIDDVVASDATIHRIDGRWWMFATVRDGGGAYSDALYLWTAPDFRGPWAAHPRNPVLIDIASARPAGRLVEREGVLFRPVQDCRVGYGAALGLARILRLDDTGFEQCVEAVMRPGHGWPGRRLHTLNAAGGLEFIDGSAEARRSVTSILATGRSS